MQQQLEDALCSVSHMDTQNISALICSYGDNNWVFVNCEMVRYTIQIISQTTAHRHEDDDDVEEDQEELHNDYYIYTEGKMYQLEPLGMLSVKSLKETYGNRVPILLSLEKCIKPYGETLYCSYKILATFTVFDEMQRYLKKITNDIETLYDLDNTITLHVGVTKHYPESKTAIRWFKDDQFCGHYHRTLSNSTEKFLALIRSCSA